MSRNGKALPLPIIFAAGRVRRGKRQYSEMMARAQAQFDAEREDFVSAVADSSVKQRLATQLGVRHALRRKALAEWSREVERRLILQKLRRSDRPKAVPASVLQQ